MQYALVDESIACDPSIKKAGQENEFSLGASDTSFHYQSAIDVECLAGHETAPVGSEKHDGSSDVFR